ncbi:MAG: hypothetical protein M3N57_06100 [Actinomycetota bacterium]|nr:hypothetical protein [Actinomycetota bacterium]
MHGRTSLGHVHVKSLLRRDDDDQATVLLIAGRDWTIETVDWKRRVVHVRPTSGRRGRPSWLGSGPGITLELAQATRRSLAGHDPIGVEYSKRAVVGVAELRERFRWLASEPSTDVVTGSDGVSWWWTFAGTDATVELAQRLVDLAPVTVSSGLALRLADGTSAEQVHEALDASEAPTDPPAEVGEAWKFADSLPSSLLDQLVSRRLRDPSAVRDAESLPVHEHRLHTPSPKP